MTRRRFLASVAAMAGAAAFTAGSQPEAQPGEKIMSEDALLALLERSRTEKRGVTLAVGGVMVPLLVTELTDAFVIGQSREHDQIVVRLDRIDAALL